jgi:hypothetical protein
VEQGLTSALCRIRVWMLEPASIVLDEVLSASPELGGRIWR